MFKFCKNIANLYNYQGKPVYQCTQAFRQNEQANSSVFSLFFNSRYKPKNTSQLEYDVCFFKRRDLERIIFFAYVDFCEIWF